MNADDRASTKEWAECLSEHECPKDSTVFKNKRCLGCGEKHSKHTSRWCRKRSLNEALKFFVRQTWDRDKRDMLRALEAE